MSDQTSGERSRERVPVDRVFDVLRHPYRRRILTTLAEVPPRDGTAFTPEAFHTGDVDADYFTTELYHAHLPKLAEAGYIDWDRATNTSYRGPNFEEIAPILRLLTEHQDELPDGWP
ncbi:MAG: hypothetical protein R3324_08340 [Halobacteriales archaeon]|nr:hypothetical protein [Halobacteriales archaeon]